MRARALHMVSIREGRISREGLGDVSMLCCVKFGTGVSRIPVLKCFIPVPLHAHTPSQSDLGGNGCELTHPPTRSEGECNDAGWRGGANRLVVFSL